MAFKPQGQAAQQLEAGGHLSPSVGHSELLKAEEGQISLKTLYYYHSNMIVAEVHHGYV